jgi:hypothetical protein
VVEHKLKYLAQIPSYNYNKKKKILKSKCFFQVGGIVELYKKRLSLVSVGGKPLRKVCHKYILNFTFTCLKIVVAKLIID